MSQIITSTQRNTRIDFLRGLSIIFVVINHIHIRLPLDQGWIKDFFPSQLVKILCWSSYYGVIAFFVISGFLITSASLRRWGELSKIEYKKFIRLRFSRIFPCLFTLLVILSFFHLTGVNGFVIKTTTLWRALLSGFTFHVNWLESITGYLPANWGVLWSLSVEEMFYVFFPLVCLFSRNKIIFNAIMLIFIALGPFSRSISDTDLWWDQYSYFSCMDAIAWGCLAALFVRKIKLSKQMVLSFFSIGTILSLFILIFRKEVYAIGLTKLGLNVTVLGLGMACLLISLHQKENFQHYHIEKYFKWVTLFGKNSYEIYLTHMFVVLFATNTFFQSTISVNLIPAWYIGILSLTLCLGWGISKYYSEPLNEFLRRDIILKSKAYAIGNAPQGSPDSRELIPEVDSELQ